MAFKEYKNEKNRHLRTFDAIKMNSRVVRVPRLILRVPTGPNKSSEAKFEFQSHLKNFCAHFNSTLHVWWSPLFEDFEVIFMKILQNHEKSQPPYIWVIKNRFMRFPMTPRTFLESIKLKVPRENLLDGDLMRRMNYFHHSLKS